MLGTEGFVDIQVLHRQGMSIKGIARELHKRAGYIFYVGTGNGRFEPLVTWYFVVV